MKNYANFGCAISSCVKTGLFLSIVSFGVVSCGGEGAVLGTLQNSETDALDSSQPQVVVEPTGEEGASLLVDDLAENNTAADDVPVIPATVIPAIRSGLGELSQDSIDTLVAALQRGSLRIMPVGDSITTGTRGFASYRREFARLMDATNCSHSMVGSQSSAIHTTNYYAAHESYAGYRAEDFLSGDKASISDATSYYHPHVVLLHVGSVDIFRGQSVVSTVAEIDQIVAAIFEARSDTVVLIANVIPQFGDDVEIVNRISELGLRIEQLVNESNYSRLTLVDVKDGYTIDMMQSDLTLPNEAGDAHVAAAIFEKLSDSKLCQ